MNVPVEQVEEILTNTGLEVGLVQAMMGIVVLEEATPFLLLTTI